MEGKASKMCGTLSYAKDLVKSFAKISHNCHLTKKGYQFEQIAEDQETIINVFVAKFAKTKSTFSKW